MDKSKARSLPKSYEIEDDGALRIFNPCTLAPSVLEAIWAEVSKRHKESLVKQNKRGSGRDPKP